MTKATTEKRKPCECGCGEFPKQPTSRFLPGHDLRKAYGTAAHDLRTILTIMLSEIEDLRAHQIVTTASLSALQPLSTTDFHAAKVRL